MPRRTTWPSAKFFYDGQRLQRIEHTPSISFHVGIWWHDMEHLVTFLQSTASIKSDGQYIDSDLSHDMAWETARRELTWGDGAEYFDVPRGRILWDTIHQSGVLYHGNSTPAEVIEELASLYRLPRWETRLDEHYLTGEALEAYYNLD